MFSLIALVGLSCASRRRSLTLQELSDVMSFPSGTLAHLQLTRPRGATLTALLDQLLEAREVDLTLPIDNRGGPWYRDDGSLVENGLYRDIPFSHTLAQWCMVAPTDAAHAVEVLRWLIDHNVDLNANTYFRSHRDTDMADPHLNTLNPASKMTLLQLTAFLMGGWRAHELSREQSRRDAADAVTQLLLQQGLGEVRWTVGVRPVPGHELLNASDPQCQQAAYLEQPTGQTDAELALALVRQRVICVNAQQHQQGGEIDDMFWQWIASNDSVADSWVEESHIGRLFKRYVEKSFEVRRARTGIQQLMLHPTVHQWAEAPWLRNIAHMIAAPWPADLPGPGWLTSWPHVTVPRRYLARDLMLLKLRRQFERVVDWLLRRWPAQRQLTAILPGRFAISVILTQAILIAALSRSRRRLFL